jgi:hypothetical protein
MTYQLAVPLIIPPYYRPEIRALQTCKQIYSEAKRIFYGKNLFSFTADFRIPTAFAFLCDRPADSLLLIPSVELALTEKIDLSPTCRTSTDRFVLQFAYNPFTELCTLLSTARMRLRNLHLTIETLVDRFVYSPWAFMDCLS